MFAVSVAHASTGIGMPRFSLYSSTSAVMYRASTCKSPTNPAVVRPRFSSSLYTFFVRLWAISVPAVARRSAARTTPSLQTSPSVVVPVSTSLETVAIATLPFKRRLKDDCQSIRPALFKNDDLSPAGGNRVSIGLALASLGPSPDAPEYFPVEAENQEEDSEIWQRTATRIGPVHIPSQEHRGAK